jgi:hypothetical protein
MKQFTCLEEIEASRQPHDLGALIEHLLSVELSIAKTTTLDPDDGAIFLLEDGDNDQILINKIGRPFSDILFEGIQHIAEIDIYVCRFLRDNQCCITLIVPDKAWLPETWRAKIMSELS